jgi:hypothetical protein
VGGSTYRIYAPNINNSGGGGSAAFAYFAAPISFGSPLT